MIKSNVLSAAVRLSVSNASRREYSECINLRHFLSIFPFHVAHFWSRNCLRVVKLIPVHNLSLVSLLTMLFLFSFYFTDPPVYCLSGVLLPP